IFSHPVYLFLREFSLQDFRGGSTMHNALSDEKLYIEVRIFLSHLLQLSPGISRKQAFHHVQFLIQEKVRSMILSYLTSNKWFAA
ncbi:hypothetical protein QSD93_005226, partial [Escherichia coli]